MHEKLDKRPLAAAAPKRVDATLPENERSLAHIAWLMPSSGDLLPNAADRLVPELEQILAPEGCRIDVVANREFSSRIPALSNGTLYSIQQDWGGPRGFGRDFFLGSKGNLLIPASYSRANNVPALNLEVALPTLKQLGCNARVLGLCLDGGNVVNARNKHGAIVSLVGADAVRDSIARSYVHNESEFCQVLQDALSVDEVRIVGQRQADGSLQSQSPIFYHTDLLLLPLPEGRIGLVTETEPNLPARRAFAEFDACAALLTDFEVIRLPHNLISILTFDTLAGAVIYRDGQGTGALIPAKLEREAPESVAALRDLGITCRGVNHCPGLSRKRGTLRCALWRLS